MKRSKGSGGAIAAVDVPVLDSGRAVGWRSAGPRADCRALTTKRSPATGWDERTWSVTFFVEAAWRRRGLGQRLLEAAVRLAKNHGATCLEGHPAPLPKSGEDLPATFAWTGLAQVFRGAAFAPWPRCPASARSTYGGSRVAR